ncbi:AAA family ATPase [Enterobacter hormaechei]
MAPPGMEEMTSQLRSMFQNLGGQKQKARKLKIKDAMKLLIEEEAAKLVNPEELKQDAIDAVEQHGIVFIDEIDKICKRGNASGRMSPAKAFSATCCRWWKGARVSTKHGMVKTDHVCLSPPVRSRLPARLT